MGKLSVVVLAFGAKTIVRQHYRVPAVAGSVAAAFRVVVFGRCRQGRGDRDP